MFNESDDDIDAPTTLTPGGGSTSINLVIEHRSIGENGSSYQASKIGLDQ